MTTHKYDKDLYAAIDVGSGKNRLIIARVNAHGEMVFVKRQPADVALAQNMSPLQENPVIRAENFEAGRGAMKIFRGLLERAHVPPENILAGATEAIRAVARKNPELASEYCGMLSEDLGCEIKIFSGEQEAIFIGATALLDVRLHKRNFDRLAVGNIGSGSSQQCVITSNGEILNPTSIPYGVATLRQESMGDLGQVRQIYDDALTVHFNNPHTEITSVLGGPWRMMRHVVCKHGHVMQGRSKIAKELARANRMNIDDFEHVDKDVTKRAGQMPIGAATLQVFARHTKPKKLIFVTHTMAEGMISVMDRYRRDGVILPGLEPLFSPSAPSPAPRA